MPHLCVIGMRGIPAFVGGIETICEKLYPGVVAKSSIFRVTVLSRIAFNGETDYHFEGVRVKVLKALKINGIETFIHTLVALVYARCFVHPTIVHLHGIGPGFFSFLSRCLGFKTIVTHHSPDYKRPKWKWHGKLILKLGELFTVLFANKIVCVSKSVYDDLGAKYNFFISKRLVIRNAGSLTNLNSSGTNALNELGLSNRRYILAVGRLDKTKGFDDLISAYKMSNCSDMKLVIVGSNYVEDSYVKSLKQNESERIIFAGTRIGPELSDLYKNAALLVNPSYMEGFCLVLAEGLSAAIPIIATEISPHMEFALKAESYFKRGDIYELAEKLSVDDYSIFRNKDAERLQEENTWELNIQQHIDVFNSVL